MHVLFGIVIAHALMVIGGAPSLAASALPAAPSFIGRQGTNFTLDGKPFFVAGVNNHYLPYGSPQEVINVLDDAVAMGANVVRTFIQPVIGSRDGISSPTIWNWRSTAEASNLGVRGAYMLYWDAATKRMRVNDGPDGLQRIDFLIAEAAKRKLKLIIAFLDFWPYTGGAQQMRAWYGSDDVYSFFAADPRTIRDYKLWVETVVRRVNTLTGSAYSDDPTIFAWELMNEPDFHPASLLKSWVSEMATYVKSIDSNHLLATGHANLYDRFADLEIDAIDFGTWHGYPIHQKVSPARMATMISEFCAIGQRFSKPMLWEEFGWARNNTGQPNVYAHWLKTVNADPHCAGWVVWRLVGRQDSGKFPEDEHDQFDVRNDGGPLWNVLVSAAAEQRRKSGTP